MIIPSVVFKAFHHTYYVVVSELIVDRFRYCVPIIVNDTRLSATPGHVVLLMEYILHLHVDCSHSLVILNVNYIMYIVLLDSQILRKF